MRRVRGFSLIEILVYVSILAVITVLVTAGVVQMGRIYGRVRVERRVALAAELSLERITKEIRLARNVTVVSSSELSLETFEDFEGSLVEVDPDRSIQLSGDAILLDGVALTPDIVTVSSLSFTRLDTTGSIVATDAIHIEMTITSSSGDYAVTRTFSTTVLSREGYS